MGSTNPAIIFSDCDFEAVIEGTMRSCFANCGQVCLGTERAHVERTLFEKFVAALAERASKLKIGRPEYSTTGMGPLISLEHRNKVLSYYRKAVEAGATVVTGGGVPNMPETHTGGAWIESTIWTGLSDSAATTTEEIFGPCCHIAPFDNEDEVIKRANALEYGLAASMWTTNLARAHRVSTRIEAGIVWVNSWFLRDLHTPFGGMKQSGIGRKGGVHSLEFYTELKNECIKLWASG